MFNEAAGVVADLGSGKQIVSYPNQVGCIIYGPYAWVEPGSYDVIFELSAADHPEDHSSTAALIDVAAAFGTVILASRSIVSEELNDTFTSFTLDINIREYRQLEFRVHVAGGPAVTARLPRLVRTGPSRDLSDADIAVPSDDPFMVAQQVRAVMRLLTPKRAVGIGKVRLGNVGDGGYVCLDDFDGVDTALSLGINDDISWDRDAADRGLTIYQFDHTVEDPAPGDDRYIFAKKMIAPDQGPDRETLMDLIVRHDKGRDRPNLFLKMDIENAEWGVLLATEEDLLSRFSQIVCELHYFQGLSDPRHRSAVFAALTKIRRHFEVVHIHANNYAAWTDIQNVVLPCVVEVAFANRALYTFTNNDRVFPTELDASCDPTRPDMFLGTFQF